MKDSLGVKNPYRYRGYRYDNETGLYYLQSRYYNPEWGRFINADGIIGQTGELLGHNLFVYTRNNPINASDPNGFMTIEGSGVGGNESLSLADNLKNVGKITVSNTINSSMDTITSNAAAKYISTGPKYVELGTWSIGKYVEKNPIGSLVKTTTGKIGVSSIIGVGFSAYDNIKKFGWTWGAAGRIGIDTLFVIGAVALNIFVPGLGFAATIAIGVGAEGFSRLAKNIIYGDNLWD